MKKFFAFAALAAVLITAFIGFAACNDKPSDTALPMLSAVGADIVDADGNAVVLRGTNFGGWLVQEGWMCPTKQTDTLSTDMTLYSRFGKEKAEALIAAYQEINPNAGSLLACLILFNLPFTLVKGLLDAAICFAIYKPLSPILHGRHFSAAILPARILSPAITSYS